MDTATENPATNATETTSPRIYVACLAAYNDGVLHGAWIDAARDAWSIYDDVTRMLAASPIPDAEEWAIHDYEGFEGARLSEYMGFDEVAGLAAFIAAHGRLGAELVAHFGDLDEARQAMENRYHGNYASLADYVQELTESGTAVPANLRYYIDWEAMARDAELGGDVFTIETAYGEVHIFGGH